MFYWGNVAAVAVETAALLCILKVSDTLPRSGRRDRVKRPEGIPPRPVARGSHDLRGGDFIIQKL